jgi:hypothetical protein
MQYEVPASFRHNRVLAGVWRLAEFFGISSFWFGAFLIALIPGGVPASGLFAVWIIVPTK